jgi:hypothetical protein
MRVVESAMAGSDMRLTDRVNTVLGAAAAPGFVDPVQAVSSYPRQREEGLTDFELDCRDWGFVFGVAYGIARGEEPYESDNSVCERAMTAAREVFSRFSASDIFTHTAYDLDRSHRPDPRALEAAGQEPDQQPALEEEQVDERPAQRVREPVPEYVPIRPSAPSNWQSQRASRR